MEVAEKSSPQPIRAAQDDVAMELYATGFNAWNQLVFEPAMIDKEIQPHDIFAFTKVLGGKNLDRPTAGLYYTKVRRDNEMCLAGASSYAENGLGDVNNKLIAENGNGSILHCQTSETSAESLALYPSISAFKQGKADKTWPWKARTTQIAAYDTGYVILYDDVAVFTLGDPRFADSLGREVTDSAPANEPGEVIDLSVLGDPMKKVAAGGYNIAALTQSGALYVWGALPSKSQGRHQTFSEISSTPNYIEVDGDKDVEDVALGESHAIALTSDGCVYVIGANTNGQLGLGKDVKVVENWIKVVFKAPDGWEIVGVEAGPGSSFIMTSKK